MTRHKKSVEFSLFDRKILGYALKSSILKLHPKVQFRNPVMFTVLIASLITTIIIGENLMKGDLANLSLLLQICLWLWFTVLFANFAEAMAEGRGKARADTLRTTQADTIAYKLKSEDSDQVVEIASHNLKLHDLVRVRAGEVIPADGEVIEGIASVDESAITGESAPVIRESGGDRSAVTGGTRVVSDWIKVKVTARPGESFLDRMIALVEGAERQKTPNELALTILLLGMSIMFLVVTLTLEFYALLAGHAIPVVYLVALFVTLAPTTISGLLSAIGIAGMDRLVKSNVIAKSGRAVEAAGDVDVLLLDKTGTITFGNRMADQFLPLPGISEKDLAAAAQLASLGDDTPEGKSIVELARSKFKLEANRDQIQEIVPFTAQTRMSGVNLKNNGQIRKGASDAMRVYTGQSQVQAALTPLIERVAKVGGTPLVVAQDKQLLGVIFLKDIVKPGIRERFAQLRKMGIRTVMITGDNPLTAAAIAAESGVDGYLAEATPEKKLELIRREQAEGRLVAMCGDGSNDAPALAQADVGVAMNDGTPAAKEAGNLIDLDSDPTKLIEVVLVGKELLMSRGALTTFSFANDVAKYFAIIPPVFLTTYPELGALNVMNLHSPESAILSACVFNAVSIIALVPLALRGVKYQAASAGALLGKNMAIYGLGGLIAPFIVIKLIDMAVIALGLV